MLVTGASGFVGRWVARCLTSVGADVVLAARDEPAMMEVARDYGIEGRVVAVDLSEEGDVDRLVRDVSPAITFHLAGYGVDPQERDAQEARRLNAFSVRWIAEAVSRWGRPAWRGHQLIHTGTALEYGVAPGNLDEATDCVPTTVYGSSKLEGTLALLERCSRGDLRATTARLFTVYGPGEHPSRLLPSLIQAGRDGREIALTAGTQRRDFTYVADVATGLLRLGVAESPPAFLVNLATGQLTTVRAFVETAAPIVGLPGDRLQFGVVPSRPEEMQHEAVTVARLQRVTSWQPGTDVSRGVRATVEILSSLWKPAGGMRLPSPLPSPR